MRFRRAAGIALACAASTLGIHCGFVAGLQDWRLDDKTTDASRRGEGGTSGDLDARGKDDAQAAIDDASLADASDADIPRCSPQALFGPGAPITELNSADNEAFARLSPDELTVYFTSDRLSASPKIFKATRASVASVFTGIGPVPELDMASLFEDAPALAADGLTLFLQATDNNSVPRNVYMATRLSTLTPFDAPVGLTNLASPAHHPYALPPAGGLGRRFAFAGGTKDVGPFTTYEAGFPVAGVPPIVSIVSFAAGSYSGFDAPVMTTDGKEFFGTEQGNIWHATRPGPTGQFSTPVIVNELNDATQFELPDWISPDNCRLYYHQSTPSSGFQLFVASRPQLP